MKTDTVIIGDNVTVLKTFDNECIDLVVTSPPYDNLREKHYESVFDFEGLAKELYRVTKPGGVVVWVVSDATINGSETLTSFKQALFFREIGFNVETMIYQQAGTGAKGSNYYYWQSFEYMFVFAKGQPKTHNRINDIKNTQGGKIRGGGMKAKLLGSRTERVGIVNPEYSVRPNVWVYPNGREDTENHPAPFPEELAKDHIITWSNPNDVVLDPFAGSGTTLKQAKMLGRKYIGIEISEEYVNNIIIPRLERTPSPLFAI